MNEENVKKLILEVIDEYEDKGPVNLQSKLVLHEVAKRLDVKGNIEHEQLILTVWHELFRSGYLAWGYNLDNPEPPFFHKVRKS